VFVGVCVRRWEMGKDRRIMLIKHCCVCVWVGGGAPCVEYVISQAQSGFSAGAL